VTEGDWQDLTRALNGVEYRFGVITADSPVYRVEFGPGLSDAEVREVQDRFGFRFPPDLRSFLQTALPRGPQFPDWRYGNIETLRSWLDGPTNGVLFDVEHNAFWLEEWGPRPPASIDALNVISELLRAAPRLIPIFSHRMMPDEPHAAGNPVLSVHQTDIIYYGFDLADYLHREFDLPGQQSWSSEPRPIRFWDPSRFQDTRWGNGPVKFDNSGGSLPI
jgi:hypothetical protein